MFGQCGGAEIEDGLTGVVPMPMPVPCKTFFLSQSTFGCGADGGGGGGWGGWRVAETSLLLHFLHMFLSKIESAVLS